MKKMHKKVSYLCFGIFLSSGQALAADYLNADEVKSLVVGNTIHATHMIKGINFTVYFDTDGSTAFRKQEGSTTKTTYEFKGDKHCIFWKGANRCANIINNGDGTYTRVNKNGKQVIKWNKIENGRAL